MSKQFKIASTTIGNSSPVFIVAEVGINHGGNMENAIELIRRAHASGADALKLQTYITEKRVGKDSPIFDVLKRCELSFAQQAELFTLGRELGVIIFSTPFDGESVDFLESVNTPVYKVASFDTVNHELLRKVASTRKPVIMSTGMTNIGELELAMQVLDGNDLALLHCVSSYPLNIEEAHLAIIRHLKSIHDGPVGYSDHTIGIDASALAVAAGAQIIEKHFTLDSRADGPDHALSADPDLMAQLVTRIHQVESIMGSVYLGVRESERATLPFRRPSS